MNNNSVSRAVILKPPTGFESIYQGALATTPLPFVAADPTRSDYLPLDPQAGKTGFSAELTRYIPMPLSGTMMLYIPRPAAIDPDDDSIIEGTYTYELRWRLRGTSTIEVTEDPAHLIGLDGAPDGTDRRELVPTFTSLVFQGSVAGTGSRVLIAPAVEGVAGQGTFDPSVFAAAGAGGDELALGPNQWFVPCWQRIYGDQLSVVAYRLDGGATWDFSGEDAGISNVYGVNQIGPSRPSPIPGLGMQLLTTARAAGP